MRVNGAVSEHANPIVTVMPSLLHDGKASAHRLSNADFDRILDCWKTRRETPLVQLGQQLLFCRLVGGGDNGKCEGCAVVNTAVADPQGIDGYENPPAVCV